MSQATATRVAPWIGCGTSGSWTDVDDALDASGLFYEVEQVNAYDDLGQKLPAVMVNRKIGTHEILGTTSDKYGLIQNLDAFHMLDPYVSAGGVIEHAGMTEQGMCFMVMRMDSQAFGFAGDSFDVFVCCLNSFNTRFPMALFVTPVRVICQNMFKNLMAKHKDQLLHIKHGTQAENRMLSATQAVQQIMDWKFFFTNELSSMAMAKRDSSDLNKFVEDLIPMNLDENALRYGACKQRIEDAREDFIVNYYHAADNANYVGTKLGLINAYYDWLCHSEPARSYGGNYQDRRFSKIMSGDAVNKKLILNA